MAITLGGDEWRVVTGWVSLGAAMLVTIGSFVLLHQIRSAGHRERPRPHDVRVVPLMTLPGFATALLLLVVGSGHLGWFGPASSKIADVTFGGWWFANAIVLGEGAWSRLEERRVWSGVALTLVTAMVIAAGLWFAREPLEALLPL
jgi:hypothetical protein